MEIQEIEITIDKKGQVVVHVRGVKGKACLDLTNDLEAILGGQVVDRQFTPESVEDPDLPTGTDLTLVLVLDLSGPLLFNLHHIEAFSRANGPGLRTTIWVQGCTLGCPGCFNPETHSASPSQLVSVSALVAEILSRQDWIEGVSISGGEPFQQIKPLAEFVRQIRLTSSLSILIFTGFTWQELEKIPAAAPILASTDILLAGRYRQDLRIASGLRGSSNKIVHFLTPRYTPADLAHLPDAEVILSKDGTITLTGIDPLKP